MAQSLTTDSRRVHEARLLDVYRTTLMAAGVGEYSADQLYDDYRRGLLAAMRIPTAGAGEFERLRGMLDQQRGAVREGFEVVIQAGEKLMRMIAERNVAAIVDTNAQELLRA
jgi:hypothetical protein